MRLLLGRGRVFDRGLGGVNGLLDILSGNASAGSGAGQAGGVDVVFGGEFTGGGGDRRPLAGSRCLSGGVNGLLDILSGDASAGSGAGQAGGVDVVFGGEFAGGRSDRRPLAISRRPQTGAAAALPAPGVGEPAGLVAACGAGAPSL